MTRTLITIVAEAVLEKMLTDDLKRLGAHGYTVTEARGEGQRGVRSADWTYNSNIRIESICERPVAEAVMAHLAKTYYANYAMIAYLMEVEVLRGEKF